MQLIIRRILRPAVKIKQHLNTAKVEVINGSYLFLCKCEMFMRRFGVEQFTGIMARENNKK